MCVCFCDQGTIISWNYNLYSIHREKNITDIKQIGLLKYKDDILLTPNLLVLSNQT